MYWNRFPLVKVFLPFLSGILSGALITMKADTAFATTFSLLVFLLLLNGISSRFSYRLRYLFGLMVMPAFFFAGMGLRFRFEEAVLATSLPAEAQGEEVVFLARITEEPVRKTKSWKLQAEVLGIADSNNFRPAKTRLLVYLEYDSLLSPPEYGEIILASGRIQEVRAPVNPAEFDYRRFLFRKGIMYQVYIRSDGYQPLAPHEGISFLAIAKKARKYLLEKLEENGLKGREFAVASAVLLGYDDMLDADQRKAFSGAGAMHVLCVSGLHVGIIYMVINLLIARFPLLNHRRRIKAVVIILLIWCYALITGMAPSVLRASAMFSFVAIGKSMGRRTHIYNSLMASALLLLILNPMIIYAVGFQLSYLAVAGIVSLQPPIFDLLRVKNKLIEKTWSLVAVSIAAQAATFPLAMLYFSQFPNYFILTNLLVIPLSTLILYCGLFSCAVIPLPYIAEGATWILSRLVYAMNVSVNAIEALPGAVSRDVFISPVFCLLLYLTLAGLAVWLIGRRKRVIWLPLLSVLLMLMLSFTRRQELGRQRQMCIYSAGQHIAIDCIAGETACFFADSALLHDPYRQGFYMGGHRIRSGISTVHYLEIDTAMLALPGLYKTHHLIDFYGFRFALINPATASFRSRKHLKTDLLILTGNPRPDFPQLEKLYSPDCFILGSCNSPFRVQQWVKELDSLGYAYHDIRSSGAFLKRI